MLESFLVAWDSSVLELDCMHSDLDFEDWIYREINIQVFSKDYGTMIFGLLDLTWKWSIHFSFLVMQMTLPKRLILLWIRDTYVFVTWYSICKENCRDFAFSSVYLSVLSIICFLLAVLHPCFVYVFENFSCSFLKLFLARDILVCVLWVEVSEGYWTDVDSLCKSDSCLIEVVLKVAITEYVSHLLLILLAFPVTLLADLAGDPRLAWSSPFPFSVLFKEIIIWL